jgi:hypothetical protein
MFFLKDITNNPGNFKFTKGSIKKFTIFLFRSRKMATIDSVIFNLKLFFKINKFIF